MARSQRLREAPPYSVASGSIADGAFAVGFFFLASLSAFSASFLFRFISPSSSFNAASASAASRSLSFCSAFASSLAAMVFFWAPAVAKALW